MVTMASKRKLRICWEGNLKSENRGDGQQECEPVPNLKISQEDNTPLSLFTQSIIH